jgi:hypothetical protein
MAIRDPDPSQLLSIGQLARRAGVPARTIRFWSDAGLVPPAHVAVLDGQIRTLRLRRAVLSTVAQRGNTIEEALLMHKLARLSAQER